MNNPATREYIDKVLSLVRKRHQAMSENPAGAALEPMYGSIVEQNYLIYVILLTVAKVTKPEWQVRELLVDLWRK